MNSKPTRNKRSNELTENKKVVAPSQKTLNFIKAYAHSYFADKEIAPAMGGFCLN